MVGEANQAPIQVEDDKGALGLIQEEDFVGPVTREGLQGFNAQGCLRFDLVMARSSQLTPS